MIFLYEDTVSLFLDDVATTSMGWCGRVLDAPPSSR